MNGNISGYHWLCALGFTVIWTVGLRAMQVRGDPILGIDLSECSEIIPYGYTENERMQCCLLDRPIVEFKLDDIADQPMRLRKAVHRLNDEEVARYKKAYEIMRSLPDDDPRSLAAQSKLHCSYCTHTYQQLNSTQDYTVHISWLVWPFHRWFTYFHERILASLVGDDSFTIPYWAWDVQNETLPKLNTIPDIFADQNSPLYHPVRSRLHVRPFGVDLTRQLNASNKDPDVLKADNYYALWQTMNPSEADPYDFLGGPYRRDDSPEVRVTGRLESIHARVHAWVGDESLPYSPDMGTAEWGAGDPIFFSHHSQADRLWSMWAEFESSAEIQDPDFLDAAFLFYNENGELARVTVRDSLNLEKLRYSYEQIPADWKDFVPKSIRQTNPLQYAPRRFFPSLWNRFNPMHTLDHVYGEASISLPSTIMSIMLGRARSSKSYLLTLGGSSHAEVISVRLPRPSTRVRTSLSKKQSAIVGEILVIKGVVTRPLDLDVRLNVFIDLPEADRRTTLSCVEALGDVCLSSEGTREGKMKRTSEGTSLWNPLERSKSITRNFSRSIGIGPRYEMLGLTNSLSVAVNLVAAWSDQHDDSVTIEITQLSLEFQARGQF